ncbi:hypothetical protein Metlim_3064 [Methanoplanus limicola DSM 2279]|uniref:SMODS and SLOG-associating 2TM effector domain-containing protein n=1 Tax=Methanoplanus limicola DSM 2279 TaxID=937775 RepID=H1YZP2_9EURY|nr:hypothetical protein Metlim_3064 [Methanoplanus limicola DSM 2279]
MSKQEFLNHIFSSVRSRSFNRNCNDYGTEDSNILLPAPLPITVNLGLLVNCGELNVDLVVESVIETLNRVNRVLSQTPHIFKFLLPGCHGKNEEMLRMVVDKLSCTENIRLETQFFIHSGFYEEMVEFSVSGISCSIMEIPADRRALGYDPISTAIVENATLMIIIGESDTESSDIKPGSIYLLAKRYGRTVVSINPADGKISDIPHDDRIFDSYLYLDGYNNEKISLNIFKQRRNIYIRKLRSEFVKAGIDEEMIKPSYDYLLPHYLKARILGKQYRFKYALVGVMIYLLSAFAVFTITMQTLFFPENPEFVWVEVGEIALIILLMVCSRTGNYHIKWIDYNFLAERIRSAFFLRFVCTVCDKPEDLPSMSPVRVPNDWMVMTFEAIISSGKVSYCNREVHFEAVKNFFISAWIQNRIVFYEREAGMARFKYHTLAICGEVIFAVTMILAIAHALGIGHWERFMDAEIPLIMAFLTITLPAFGGALSAIRVQREYHRNSERYFHLLRHLTAIKTEMMHITNMSDLCLLLKEMNEMTFREINDWKIVFRYHNIEAV